MATVLVASIDELFEKDGYLFTIDAHENCIASKLQCLLQNKIGTAPVDGRPWDVDFDYNRFGDTIKSVDVANHVRPDIIVHRRGTNNNFLVIELKKGASKNLDDLDLVKLHAYKKSIDDNGLGYKFALFLRFGVIKEAKKVSCAKWV